MPFLTQGKINWKFILIAIVFVFILGGIFFISTQSNILSKINPDSNFYFLKTWNEQIQLFFTFNLEDKAERQLYFSDIRLIEYKNMFEKGKSDLAQKVLEKYEKQMNKVIEIIEKLEQENKNTINIAQKLQKTLMGQIDFLEVNFSQFPEYGKEVIEGVLDNSLKYFAIPQNWQSYRNEVFGFGVNYPSSWEIWQVEYGDTKKYIPSLTAQRLAIGSKDIEEADWGVETYGALSLLVKTDETQNYHEMVSQKDSYLKPSDKKESVISNEVEGFKYTTEINSVKIFTVLFPLEEYIFIMSSNAGVLSSEFYSSLKEKIILSLIVKSIDIFEPQEVALWDISCSLPELSILEIEVEQGEGLTHVARKAINAYVTGINLQNFPQGTVQLLPEEKVCAEDFIVKQLKTEELLYRGDIVEIPCSIVESALRAVRQLTIQQRKNLGAFSGGVTEFEVIKNIQDIIDKSTEGSGLTPLIITP